MFVTTALKVKLCSLLEVDVGEEEEQEERGKEEPALDHL